MKAVIYNLRIIIKQDLMKKIGTTVAFNTLDKWWEESERQSKVIFYLLQFFFGIIDIFFFLFSLLV